MYLAMTGGDISQDYEERQLGKNRGAGEFNE